MSNIHSSHRIIRCYKSWKYPQLPNQSKIKVSLLGSRPTQAARSASLAQIASKASRSSSKKVRFDGKCHECNVNGRVTNSRRIDSAYITASNSHKHLLSGIYPLFNSKKGWKCTGGCQWNVLKLNVWALSNGRSKSVQIASLAVMDDTRWTSNAKVAKGITWIFVRLVNGVQQNIHNAK